MEVQPKHTIGSVIETIVDHEKLDNTWRYTLTLGNRSFAKEQYLLKVKDSGISQGDHLFLESESVHKPVEERPIIAEAKQLKQEAKAVAQVEAQKIEAVSKFCLQCGKPLREGSKFCLECGTPTRKR